MPSRHVAIAATLLAGMASTNGHGIFWSPTSRAILSEQEGYEGEFSLAC